MGTVGARTELAGVGMLTRSSTTSQFSTERGSMFKHLLSCVLSVFAVFLVGCGDGGGGGGDPVPPNSTVQINQPEITWEIGEPADPCVVDPNYYHDHTIAISVLDPDNSPLGGVDLRIVADLSGNTFSGTTVLQLYDDRNANGVVDDPRELVSSNTMPAFRTETDRYTGTKNVLLRVNLSCPYRGSLHVFAGAAYNHINVEVKAATP
jgi:hypothetical protein